MMREASYRILIVCCIISELYLAGGGGGGPPSPLGPLLLNPPLRSRLKQYTYQYYTLHTCNCLKMISCKMIILMHVAANVISPSDTALGSFRTLSVTKEICARMKSCMSSNLSQYYSFLLIYSPLILRTAQSQSVHALPRGHGYACLLTRKSFSESYVLWSARKG